VKDTVVAIGADGKGLGVVLEGIGRGFRTLIDHGEFTALLEEIEGGVGADAMDAARSYVSSYAKVAHVGLVAHALEFTDCDVVALIVAAASECKIGDCGENDYACDDDFGRVFFRFVRHMSSVLSVRPFRTEEYPLPGLFLRKVFKTFDLALDLRINHWFESIVLKVRFGDLGT
jgi:hypothetical protein